MQHAARSVRPTCVILPPILLAASLLQAQTPAVGDINYYGIRQVNPARLQAALGVKPGDPLPPSKGALEEKLEEVPGVVQARVTAVCCEGTNAILFAGIEERGAARFALRSEPAGNVTLPESVSDAFGRFLDAVDAAGRRGSMAEDLTAGHSLMADPEVRALQTGFVELAARNLAILSDVVRNASVPEQRAMAAALIGYAPQKAGVVDDLQYALQDPDESVRGNAMRSLIAIAVLAAREPSLGIRIAPTWFVEMLNSIALSDRTRAAEALVTLTERDRGGLQLIRARALAAVAEMARWKTLRYAVPSFVLMGRMAGLAEEEIHKRWEQGDRESVISRVTRPRGK
jgi:hypothetical protein